MCGMRLSLCFHRSGPSRVRTSRWVLTLIGVLSLAASGSTAQDFQGYTVRSVTYEFTEQNRTARERGARRDAQDQCYFAGDTYAQPAGPPRVVNEGDGHFRATLSFYCVGMRGEG